ncbi:DUF2798 domain-containing protein [Pleionea sediminis]|uniref:DUF2798 domain-containing protein n=1 Tax=Pleionea sediminis TaxID=2569479 RepID=UPI0011856B95|nr:DUF2798 domain-containing protein [Pleionea sediminis]
MIPARFATYLVSFFMALFMSGIMSLVITVFNIGITSDLFVKWLNAWGFAFAVALPTIFVIAPLVRKLVTLLIAKEHALLKTLKLQ